MMSPMADITASNRSTVAHRMKRSRGSDSPRPTLPVKARAAVAKLQSLLTTAPTEAIVAYATSVLISIDSPRVANAFGMSSPYRQAYFLLGLLSATPEPAEARDLTEAEYKSLPPLLNAAFSAYVEHIFVNERDGRAISAEDARDIEIAGPEFIKYYMTGRLAVAEQLEERILGVFAPLDQKMKAAFAFTAREAVKMVKWIVDEVLRRLEQHSRYNDDLKKAWEEWRTTASDATSVEELRSGPAFDRAQAAAQGAYDTVRTMSAFSRGDFISQFGSAGEAFLSRFVSRRGDNPGLQTITERNPVRFAPLFAIDDDYVVMPLGNALYEGVHDALIEAGPNVFGASFFKARTSYVEHRLEAIIRRIFPANATVLTNCYETSDLHHEHDVVVLHDRVIYVFEAKGTPPIEPPTDIRRASVRLQRAFTDKDRGIQKGFDQARHLLDRIATETNVTLYGKKRAPVLQIGRGDIDATFAVVVTADDFGALAVDLSILLRKPTDCPYPWVVNLFDLETLVNAFQARAWGPEQLTKFLNERALLHGHVLESDELAVAGVFISHGSFEHFTPIPNAKYTMKGADVFDNLYLAEHGGPPVTFEQPGKPSFADLRTVVERRMRHITAKTPRKVGRNDPCVCGSTLKYKKCCGRR
jgi:hypothetical protein